MPIDKITPRQLDSDSDSKLAKKSSLLDALNLYSGDSEEGNRGVLKNIKGNTKITPNESEEFGVDYRVLGSVTDKKTDIVYFFVFSSDPIDHGVWAYDPRGLLADNGEEALKCIYKSNQFNFPSQGFVKGDVVHINNRTFEDRDEPDLEKDAILYFTDGVNEPRKLNVYRAFKFDFLRNIHGSSEGNDNSIYDEADFITACPKAPLQPITFTFSNDSSIKTSNFKTEPGFQFAYQNVYPDGFESAISCYSDIAFPPSIISQGAQEVDHSLFNVCNLVIPAQGKEVEKIKILARKGNTFNFFVIDEVQANNQEQTFSFRNDRVTKAVSESEVNKQFDNLPRKAKAQAVTANRMVYGNYIDGYDNVPSSCEATLTFADRPNDFVDLGVKVKPCLSLHGVDGIQKSTGFELDFSEIPDSYSEGDTINFSITVAPENNWHIYKFEENKSYHQTPLVGAVKQEAPDRLFNGINANAEDFFQEGDAGQSFLSESANPSATDGKVFGIGGDVSGSENIMWKSVHGAFDGFEVQNVGYGTSAGNPFILKGSPVTYTANFSFDSDYPSGGRNIVAQAISIIISSGENTTGGAEDDSEVGGN